MDSAANTPVQTSATGFWQKIGSFFRHAAVAVAGWFESEFGPAAHTFATGAEALLETQLGQIAMAAVEQAAGLESGTEKAAAAGAAIEAAAKQAGLALTDSLKNLLIELAVQKLKGTFGPSTN